MRVGACTTIFTSNMYSRKVIALFRLADQIQKNRALQGKLFSPGQQPGWIARHKLKLHFVKWFFLPASCNNTQVHSAFNHSLAIVQHDYLASKIGFKRRRQPSEIDSISQDRKSDV